MEHDVGIDVALELSSLCVLDAAGKVIREMKVASEPEALVEVMSQEVETLTKRVLDEVKVEPTCRRLMTVPGVGPLTALAFRASIDQPGRFRSSRDVGAHFGLTPRRYQSGETDVQGSISRCGDELARTAAVAHGHRKTSTFIGCVSEKGMIAPYVLDGAGSRVVRRLYRAGPRSNAEGG